MTYQELIDTREIDGFTIKTFAQAEDMAVRGNCIASGDDKYDTRVENRIIKRLDNGDLSAWFCARVVAYKAGVELAEDYLGGCSYKSFKDFLKAGDYHSDMIATVIDRAKETIAAINA